jgi:uncharacterized protein
VSKIALITHDNCSDGFLSRTIASKYLDRHNKVYDMFSAAYPWSLPEDFCSEYNKVYVIDFSLSDEDFLKLHKNGLEVIWIDHHISAIERTIDNPIISNFEGIRQDGIAGSRLAWDYFFPPYLSIKTPEYVPLVVRHVAVRDVWGDPPGSGNIPEDAKNFDCGLRTFARTEKSLWDQLLDSDDFVKEVCKIGRLIRNMDKTKITSTMNDPRRCSIGTFDGNKAVFISMPTPEGEQADIVADEHGDRLQVWHSIINMNGRLHVNLSFRARDNALDCSKIARKLGGGGHVGAGGAIVLLEEFNKMSTLD